MAIVNATTQVDTTVFPEVGRGDILRVCIGWTTIVAVVSFLVAIGGIPRGDIPWPAAWFFFLPSILTVIGGRSKGYVAMQCVLGSLAAIFITAQTHLIPAPFFGLSGKFMPVAFAALLTSFGHICSGVSVRRSTRI